MCNHIHSPQASSSCCIPYSTCRGVLTIILSYIQAVKEEYKEIDAELGIERTFRFESDNVEIGIPLEGITKQNWKIRPLTNPVVKIINMNSLVRL